MHSRLIIAAAAVAALAAGLAAGRWYPGAEPPQPVLARATLLPTPRPLPAFSLAGADGGPVDPGRLQGHWTLIFFGFTHCPDICPTTLATIARGLNMLPEATRPQVLLVSVDPERDTPEVLARYLAHFDPDYLGATSSLDELERFATSVGAVFSHQPDGDGGYRVDHTAALFLLDPEVRLAAVFTTPHSADALAGDLAAIHSRRPGGPS